jgi:hypothetical protein
MKTPRATFQYLSIVFAVTACGGAAGAPPIGESAARNATASVAPKMAPTPYTAAQIRDGSPAGRHIVFKVEEPGKPEARRILDFVKTDATGADTHAAIVDSAGHESDVENDHATWEELRAHAEFPVDVVTVTHQSLASPLGQLACTVYKVKGDAEHPDMTFYFADTMPGPPVMFYFEKNGQRLKTSTMVESRLPK